MPPIKRLLLRRPPSIHQQLHQALVDWQPAGDASIAAVSEAAEQIPALVEHAKRIRHDGGRLADWWPIAKADPYDDWSDLRAFAENMTNFDNLVEAGAAVRHGGDPGTASEISRGRATWAQRCVVVGHENDNGQPQFIDGLNQGMLKLPYPWSADSTPTTLGRIALIADRFSFRNYFHWISGGLRRLLLLDISGMLDNVDETLILVNKQAPDYIRQSIDAVGLGHRRVTVQTEPIDLRADSIVLCTSAQVTPALPPRKFGPLLRARLDTGDPPSAPRRILISRGDASVRRVANEEQLLLALESHGFEVVVPGEMTFVEQADAFRQAEMVVGPHGAAMTNLLNCTPDTVVVELQDLACSRPWFKRLAESNSLSYHAVPCPAPPNAPGDLVADIEQVLAVVNG